MNVPSYEVGRVAALTVRLMRASGLSHDDAVAALDLACRMMDDEMAPRSPATGPVRPGGVRPPATANAVRPNR
ncbi:hypothetical protein [Cupriavidus cauae]|uniref:Uncharacterized protein n=1 Tax=Cupriavidus cauae TaxID=2608999 RepID=A0A5M8A910_9BURK|nr:hypothetical protein [Cupriavidus cauae]KAA0181263.1 hypothetical protein FX016_11345 [Cupriavidus gilardii]KAA6118841.1 hypothetical protein F1599_19145 [Cupriavidus cauae]